MTTRNKSVEPKTHDALISLGTCTSLVITSEGGRRHPAPNSSAVLAQRLPVPLMGTRPLTSLPGKWMVATSVLCSGNGEFPQLRNGFNRLRHGLGKPVQVQLRLRHRWSHCESPVDIGEVEF